jgi:hypothetical protein
LANTAARRPQAIIQIAPRHSSIIGHAKTAGGLDRNDLLGKAGMSAPPFSSVVASISPNGSSFLPHRPARFPE